MAFVFTSQITDETTGKAFLWSSAHPLRLFVYPGMPETDTGVRPEAVLNLTRAALNGVNDLISPRFMEDAAAEYLSGGLTLAR